MAKRSKKKIASTSRSRPRRQESPWVVLDGDICEVPLTFLRGLSKKQTFKVVFQTYRHILGLDDPAYEAWFSVGVLTDVDRTQDTEIVRRLSLGLHMLETLLPVTARKARRIAEESLC